MTADVATDFITKNGAFGVLVLLIAWFCWKGLPWLARRDDSIRAEHKAELTQIIAAHERAVNGIVSKLESIAGQLGEMVGELKVVREDVDQLKRQQPPGAK